ncbi:MAG TPA: NnrU family protein, partial [Candidatus Binatia bacterium]
LLALFGIQHSVMARQGFKRWWTEIVPRHLERSTYVLISDLIFVLLIWQWQPMTGVVWQVENPIGTMVLWGLFAIGWLTVVLTSFMINHFDLLGTRQVYLHLIGKEYTPLQFKTKGFYKYMRHPLMLGWIIAFWSTPQMSVGHLVFAIGTTVYILIAIQIEEKDLVSFHGEAYESYQREVSMLLPFRKNRRSG